MSTELENHALRVTDAAIAITGVGLVTALGRTADETWAAVLAGRCGMGAMGAMESALPPGSDGGQAPDLPADFAPDLPREVRYLRWTILAALADADAGAGDAPGASPAASDRRAVMLGTTLHGMRAGGRFLRSGDCHYFRDFLAGDTLRRAVAGLGLTGPAATTCSACSSSLGSVALGVTLLQTGQADLVVAGGYDTISEYAWAGFNALRLVSPGPLRPFTRGRQGMKLGEGYGIVVLERAADAARRGGRVRALVAGWGESADAHHLTQPHPNGEGAARAMQSALAAAGIEAGDLGLAAAHATGTPDNDAAEYAALAHLLGDCLSHVPVVGFKSHLGHTLGAAGTAELILSALAIRDGVVPACANVEPGQVEFDGLRVTAGRAMEQLVRHTLNTSLGFGGANTCVVLSSADDADPTGRADEDASGPSARPGRHAPAPSVYRSAAARVDAREVWITGVGVVLPGAVGNHAFVARLRDPGPPAWARPPAPFGDADVEHLLNARRVRRMSTYVKLTLAAATLACRDAGLDARADLPADAAALLGTTHGSSGYCHQYYAQLVREGVGAANPVLFAEGVPNAGAAHLSLMLGLRGACQSIIGTRTAGLDALRLAWLRVASGAVDRVIVGAGEESCPTVDQAYATAGLLHVGSDGAAAPFGEPRGFRPTAGAVSLLVESADSARLGGRVPYARIEHAAALSGEAGQLPRTLARLLAGAPRSRHVLCSANATWLDRAERIALARLGGGTTSVGGAYDGWGEAFSATPLIGIAAALLRGDAPALAAPPPAPPPRAGRAPRWARRGEPVGRFTALCTDWTGAAAAATLRPLARTPGGD